MFDPISISSRLSQAIVTFSALANESKVGKVLNQVVEPTVGSDKFRYRVLDVLLNLGIPFNRWLGLKIDKFGPEEVRIVSPETTLRRNHVGTAHACAQALIGEYAAGLVIAQRYPLDQYRMIIGKLEINYEKAGKGKLFGSAKAPEVWPEETGEEIWVPMETRITNEAGQEVSVCRTRWQVKPWNQVGYQKQPTEQA